MRMRTWTLCPAHPAARNGYTAGKPCGDAHDPLKAHNILAGQPGKAVYVVAIPSSVDSTAVGVDDLSQEVQRLREQVDGLLASREPASGPDIEAEIDYIRRLVGVLQTHLIDLYGRVGQPYPYESLPSEPELRRTS